MIMNDECRGCTALNKEECVNGCEPHISKTEHCPCINCIVKVMCNSVCEKFIEYTNSTYHLRGDRANGNRM